MSARPQTRPADDSCVVALADVKSARRRIRPCIPPTPMAHSEHFSSLWGCEVFFKFENLHTTGSFKVRGAANKLASLSGAERRCGVIAASAGNHGQALACHAQRLGIPACVVMPVNTPLIKVQNTQSWGARVVLHGGNYDEALRHARELCAAEGLTFIPGFDDPHIVAGQGTCGLEMLEQCPPLDTVIVPVGGGGLVAGMALAMKEINPKIRIVGVQSAAVPSMRAALSRRKPVEVPPRWTIADGVAVRRVGELPLALVRRYVDDIVTVNEDEIANAILLLLEREKAVVEGAGAVGVAAVHNGHIRVKGRQVGIVLSGGNIDVNVVARIIQKGLVKDGRLVKFRVLVPDYPGELARILAVVAEGRGNILEISHGRALSEANVGETLIDLSIETRGPGHIGELQAELVARGCRVTREAY